MFTAVTMNSLLLLYQRAHQRRRYIPTRVVSGLDCGKHKTNPSEKLKYPFITTISQSVYNARVFFWMCLISAVELAAYDSWRLRVALWFEIHPNRFDSDSNILLCRILFIREVRPKRCIFALPFVRNVTKVKHSYYAVLYIYMPTF